MHGSGVSGSFPLHGLKNYFTRHYSLTKSRAKGILVQSYIPDSFKLKIRAEKKAANKLTCRDSKRKMCLMICEVKGKCWLRVSNF